MRNQKSYSTPSRGFTATLLNCVVFFKKSFLFWGWWISVKKTTCKHCIMLNVVISWLFPNYVSFPLVVALKIKIVVEVQLFGSLVQERVCFEKNLWLTFEWKFVVEVAFAVPVELVERDRWGRLRYLVSLLKGLHCWGWWWWWVEGGAWCIIGTGIYAVVVYVRCLAVSGGLNG